MRTKLDIQILSRFLRGEKELQPVKEKVIEKGNAAKNEPPFSFKGTVFNDSVPIDNAVKDLHSCGIGEFIAVVCSSFNGGDAEEYSPYPQVWFTDEEAAEKCNRRGYTITAAQARKLLGRILDRGHRLMEYRENITIGRREYRRVRIMREDAKKYFGVEAPALKMDGLINGEWKPPQEYRTRYNRGKTYKR